MKRSKPFFYSLALHAAVVALFVGAIGTVRHISTPEEKIAVSLMAYNPAVAEPAPPPELPPEAPAKIKPPVKPEPPKTKPAPAAIPAKSAKTPATSAESVPPPSPPQSAPVPAAPAPKSQPAEPTVAKIPPPPINHQKAYEDEHLARIRTLLAQNLVYPKNARRLNQQGDVVVMFSLSPAGEVGAVSVTKSSGFELLDEAALNLIKTTSPQFPKPAKTVQISVPIGYRLR